MTEPVKTDFPLSSLAAALVAIEDGNPPELVYVLELPKYWALLVVNLAIRAGCPMLDAPWRYDSERLIWVEKGDN